jgi:hypothetical protein
VIVREQPWYDPEYSTEPIELTAFRRVAARQCRNDDPLAIVSVPSDDLDGCCPEINVVERRLSVLVA